jgi:hypothetical protein
MDRDTKRKDISKDETEVEGSNGSLLPIITGSFMELAGDLSKGVVLASILVGVPLSVYNYLHMEVGRKYFFGETYQGWRGWRTGEKSHDQVVVFDPQTASERGDRPPRYTLYRMAEDNFLRRGKRYDGAISVKRNGEEHLLSAEESQTNSPQK